MDKALSFNPTAILLDVDLPGMSGYEVARRLRDMPQFSSTLLIAITGYLSISGSTRRWGRSMRSRAAR